MSDPRSLDKMGDRLSPRPGWAEGRRRAIQLRYTAARLCPTEAVCRCGRRVHAGLVTVTMREGKAKFGGVQTCGSVWLCPVCAGYVAEGRRREVRAIAEAHGRLFDGREARSLGVIQLGAFTMPHHRFQTARELRRAITAAWSRLVSGKPWLKAKLRATCTGWVRALEVTHGDHGWHPHIHAAFFLADGDGADELGIWLYERWARIIERMGFGECSPLAWSWQLASTYDAALDYVVKGNFDYELTRGHMKLGKRGGRSPFQLLADAADGDKQAGALYREFAAAFKGARQVTYSKGLRDLSPDDEALAAEVGELIGTLPNATYRIIAFRGLLAATLEAAERGRWAAVVEFLEGEGIDVPSRPTQQAA